MASYQLEEKCEECGYLCAVLEVFSSGQFYFLCERCGYHFKGVENSLEKTGGKGAYRLQPLKGLGTIGQVDLTKRHKLEQWVKENVKNLKIAFYTRKVRGQWIKHDLINNKQEVIKANERI